MSGLTPEQYLEIDRAAEFKSEYYCGIMRAMPVNSGFHCMIMTRIGCLLMQRLDGGPCSVVFSDLRLGVSREGLYTYPDVTVIRGPLQLADDQMDTLLNPTVIVEVLS